jgi:deoxyribodipyrimidine photo-lyase
MAQLVWFKRDLRSIDHRPLAEAAARGPVLPLYVVEPDYWALPDTSRRQWLAIRAALVELRARLAELGAPLVVRSGDVVAVLARIHAAIGIDRLLAHEETGNGWSFARDRAVRRFCRESGIAMVEWPQFGVTRGLRDRDQWGRRHRMIMSAPLVAEPVALAPVAGAVAGDIPTADALGLAADPCATPQPGTRAQAIALLDSFFAGRGASYRRGMSSPLRGAAACSRLSVGLSTGAVSVREVLQRCFAERGAPGIPVAAIDSLVSRLHWHCHFIQKLESEPALEARSLHPAHQRARVETPADDPGLLAWSTGRTGLPFVDACMRSLIATGWLNFRMRAMLVSFACYQVRLDWRACGLRLARLFTDYEPGIHWPQVQMQAGQTGINTPRMYNPVKQGLEHDPHGAFTRRWVPELAAVPSAFLQEPWRMDDAMQHASRCVIGRDYPAPIVDHAASTRAARAALSVVRHAPGYRDTAHAVFARHGSRTRRLDDDDPARTRAVAARARRQLALDL